VQVFASCLTACKDYKMSEDLNHNCKLLLKVIVVFTQYFDLDKNCPEDVRKLNIFRVIHEENSIAHLQFTLSKICCSFMKLEKVLKDDSLLENMTKSNLFSGGIENRFLNYFSEETKKSIQHLAIVENDANLMNYVTKDELNEEDSRYIEIIEPGTDKIVDKVIDLFQWDLVRRHIWAKSGGKEGILFTRCAFGLMVKFNQQGDNFEV
jgi:hypothetical protein